MKGFDRRQVLEGLAALPWLLLAGCGPDVISPAERARAILLAILDRIPLPDPLEIGRGFLKTHATVTADALARDVLQPLGGSDDAAALVDSVGRQISDDFTSERVLEIEGWFVALTEARVCALIALLQPRRPGS